MTEAGHGNLLTADVDALVNTVNTVGVMGKGIALQFRRAFPANYRAYRAACARGEVQLGRVFLFDSGLRGPRRYIINFPTKGHWRGRSRLEDITAGLDALVTLILEVGITSVAIPALGCGNGGLEWADVRPVIEQAAARIPEVRVVLFAPEGSPPPGAMPNATAPPPLTVDRALLLTAVDRYLVQARLQEVRNGISELEIQKLAYLLQVLGAPFGFTFARARYGPYSPELSRALDRLEGHYLTGLGDRSAPVTEFAPINTTPGTADAAARALRDDSAALARLDSLAALVAGFETPYSLELLGTVHFAAVQDPPTSRPADLVARVSGWSLRKARLFTESHVLIAAGRLAERQLLPA